MTTVAQQVAMLLAAERRSAELEQEFLSLVDSGMTRAELEANIARRPAVWARFSGWLEKLP